MLQPIRTKFRKAHKGRIHGKATSATELNFGQYGLKAIVLKRFHPRGRGRAGKILKPFANLTIVVRQVEASA